MSIIKISINGEDLEIDSGQNIFQLVSNLELDIDKIAIEKNKEIIHLEQYSEVKLKSGDSLEVIHFVGGG